MDDLKLTFPSPHPGTHLLFETHVEEFTQWLEELPAGNMPRYVKEVADAITNINRTEMPIVQRLALIQQVDIAYEKIHNFYRPLMKSGPHKGKHAPQRELKEIYRLTRELSFAYKIAVYAFLDKKPLFGKNKNLANVINMALHYLGLVLLEHYELYAPIPMHIWREIHQLYYSAEQRYLSEIANDIHSLKNCFDVVETTYLRICLLSMSNPYHLKRGDHWEVFIYLSHWTKHSIISEDSEDLSDKNCFVINLEGDDKPQSIKELLNKENPNYRFLLTEQLNIKLCHNIDSIKLTNKSINKCFSDNVIASKATQLLEELLSSWESKHERMSPRYPKISKMEVIWGLSDIHSVLRVADPLQENVTAEEKTASIELIESEWNTINSSEGGICITQHKEKITEIDVGLLVAIRKTISDQTTGNWLLGGICWIISNKRNGTQIGIKYLKGDIQAVKLQARKGNKIETRYHSALLLLGEEKDGVSVPTLIASNGLYVESRPMLLRIGEVEQYIHARIKLSSIGSVDRFNYQKAHQHIAEDEEEQTEENQIKSNAQPEKQPEEQPKSTPKPTSKVSKSESDQNASEDEVIDLSAMPLAHIEDFEADSEEARKNVVTLDDMIVSKNK